MSGFVHGRLASPQDTNETERSGGLQGITKNKTGRKRRFLVLRVLCSQHTTSRKEGILLGRDQGETGPDQNEGSRLADTLYSRRRSSRNQVPKAEAQRDSRPLRGAKHNASNIHLMPSSYPTFHPPDVVSTEVERPISACEYGPLVQVKKGTCYNTCGSCS